MTDHGQLFIVMTLAAAVFLALALGELVRRVMPSNPEAARKTVHFLSGMIALSFPYVIRSHWTVLALAAGFSMLIWITKQKGRLRSVHDVQRKTLGAFYLPAAIYGVFLLASDRPVLYFVSILVMTVSDTLAALLGKRYGSIRYEVEGSVKTLEGSIVFFFVTFLCIHLSLLLMTPIDRPASVVIAFVIALLITGFEAISVTGSDNILIPFGTYYILAKMTPLPFAALLADLWTLLGMIVVTLLLALRSRLFKANGLIGMVMLNYAAWNLCDFFWFLPLLIAQFLLYLMARFFSGKVSEDITGYQIKVFVYTASVPILLIFIANTVNDYTTLYLSYITSIVGQIALIGSFFLSLMVGPGTPFLNALRTRRLLSGALFTSASVFLIAALPVSVYREQSVLLSLFFVAAGTVVSLCLFHVLMLRYHLMEKRLLRLRMRLLSVMIGSAAVFLGEQLLLR